MLQRMKPGGRAGVSAGDVGIDCAKAGGAGAGEKASKEESLGEKPPSNCGMFLLLAMSESRSLALVATAVTLGRLVGGFACGVVAVSASTALSVPAQ